jgi:predicted regulator of Ras-like GTPase activity (Roadblock/LC7/MglB family)
MAQLETALASLAAHPGVEHVLVLGRDGLLITHTGGPELDAETASAMVPGIAGAASALGHAAGQGDANTIVVRTDDGVALVAVLSAEILLAVLLRGDAGFAPLLRELAQRRGELAGLV